MSSQQPRFTRKKLVIAMGLVMFGGALSGCDHSNDPAAPAAQDPLGTFTILANGGKGGVKAGNFGEGLGGDGGEVLLYNDGGEGGAAILLRGTANTEFTRPAAIAPGTADLGDKPLNINADTTIDTVFERLADGSGNLSAGDPYVGTDGVSRTSQEGFQADYDNDSLTDAGTDYLIKDEAGIYSTERDFFEADKRYSGLSVAAGATLTLGQNNLGGVSVGNNSIPQGVAISFSHDIDNSGIITRSAANNDFGITLIVNYYYASGNIDNAGVEDAESGGDTIILAANGIVNSGEINASGWDEADESGFDSYGGEITLNTGGYVLNSGELDSSGGDGNGTGGNGGHVDLQAAYIENTAAINMSGGNNISDPAVSGDGGEGADLSLHAGYVAINTGAVDGSGGDGAEGGRSGNVDLNSGDELKNAGNIILNGGHVAGNVGAGPGGRGGDGGKLSMSSGRLFNSGDLSTVGGDTVAADFDAGVGGTLVSHGGDGGEINFDGGDIGFDGGEGLFSLLSNVEVSGHLNVSGGNVKVAGSTGGGGAGGGIYLNLEDGADNGRVALLGYASIDANGGDGANGGDAFRRIEYLDCGTFDFPEDDAPLVDGVPYCPADPADPDDPNAVPVEPFEHYVQGGIEVGTEYGPAQNDVPVNIHGGEGIGLPTEVTSGGWGGDVSIFTYDDTGIDADADEDVIAPMATNTAAIDLSGGASIASLNNVGGGDGGEFMMSSIYGSGNSGAVTANGAAGGDKGGDGGEVSIVSFDGESKNTGEIAVNGAEGALRGGDGGEFVVVGITTVNSGDISVIGANATKLTPDPDPVPAPGTLGGDGGDIGILGFGLDAATNSGTFSYSFGTGETDGEEGSATVNIECEGNCIP